MSLMAKLTQTWHQSVDAEQDAIVDNLCALIASRASLWGRVIEPEILRDTIVHFGLYNSVARFSSKSTGRVIVAEIVEQIRYFEPRLRQIEVDIPAANMLENPLPFRISAVMCLPLGDEAIVLDSFLDLTRHQLDVRKSNLV